MSFNNEPPPLYTHGSQIPKVHNISAQACICVEGENPNRNQYIEGMINAVVIIKNLSDLVDYYSIGRAFATGGAIIAGREVASQRIEEVFTPNYDELLHALTDLIRKNASQDGYNLYVRVKYTKQEHYVFNLYNPQEVEYTKWSQWIFDGYDGKGSFQGRNDITENIVKKAMEWRTRLFVRQGL